MYVNHYTVWTHILIACHSIEAVLIVYLFQEYYDLTKDPHQLTNTIKSLSPEKLASLHKQLVILQLCQGNTCRELIPPDDEP